MGIKKISIESIKNGSKSNKMWDQDTAQGALVPIASVNLNQNVTLNFGNIPQTYQDLMIIINGHYNNSGVLVMDDFNNGAPTCSFTSLIGTGSAASSERLTSNGGALPVSTAASPMIANVNSFIIHILNYTNSNTFKTVISRKASDNNGSGTTSLQVGLIQTTSPLSYFKFSTQNGANFFTSGVATLYGIKAGA